MKVRSLVVSIAAVIGVTTMPLISSVSFAAVPEKAPLNPKVFEILNLPSDNRSQAAIASGPEMHQEFSRVAFSESQPMRLRWRALMVLAESRGEKSTTEILKASVHKQWFMRNAALVAMSEVNEDQAKKLATKMLKDKALVVRSAAVDILQKNATAEVRDVLWEEMGQKHNFRNKESLWIRAQIVEALALKPADYEMKMFSKLLKDPDQRVQVAAIGGMEKLTGVKLGESVSGKEKLVLLWQKYVQKEKLAL